MVKITLTHHEETDSGLHSSKDNVKNKHLHILPSCLKTALTWRVTSVLCGVWMDSP